MLSYLTWASLLLDRSRDAQRKRMLRWESGRALDDLSNILCCVSLFRSMFKRLIFMLSHMYSCVWGGVVPAFAWAQATLEGRREALDRLQGVSQVAVILQNGCWQLNWSPLRNRKSEPLTHLSSPFNHILKDKTQNVFLKIKEVSKWTKPYPLGMWK